ncbi:hypothetical protein [Enterovirga sp.]|jgi:hypothetical protein|uniref:hypothetical protein n=1 Tax=Enterovirga sp. TaxID=2026350 RepID=UPI002610DB90|nr:hypothetical protein [Enterovirga sp.]MDB5590701.1 hypothetical protein [Enterovirga sp.]
MVVVLVLLAVSMIGIGGAAVVFGAPIIQIERGWTMVLAGTVGACSGILLLGVALAAQRVGRAAQELLRIRERLSRMELSAPPAAAPVVTDLRPVEQPAPPRYEAAPDGPAIVGQYASGGNSYVMYSDGSIQADTPAGKRRFSSLDDLRAFVAAGGERAA